MATQLEPGDMLPGRKMEPLNGGSTVRVGPNRVKSQVVVVTHPEPCDDCATYLASWSEVADELEPGKEEVLAVVGPGWDGESAKHAPVKLLPDDGVLAARLTPDGNPVVAVSDRYGQLFQRYDAGTGHAFPGHERVLRLLLDIAIRCPECGVPDIPTGLTLPEAGTKSAGIHVHQ